MEEAAVEEVDEELPDLQLSCRFYPAEHDEQDSFVYYTLYKPFKNAIVPITKFN